MRWYVAVLLVTLLVAGVAAVVLWAQPLAEEPPVDCASRPDLTAQADIVERVGGLVGDRFTVRYARASEVGVVALVEGDVERAREELSERYDVTIVAAWDEEAVGEGRDAFAQLDAAVAEHCP